MLDNTILSNGFGSLLKKLQENNIETTQEELSSLFFDTLNTNNATSITTIDFANSIQQTYGLKSNEEILEILTKVSENDGTKDNLSAVDFEKQAEIENETQQILEEYDSEEWNDVEPIQKSRLFGSDTFVYTTSDGSTIEVKNSEGIEVKQNLITGEIVVIGANNASIELKEGANLTVVESIIEDIKANSGNETINVRGAHTTVVNIDGGKGNQNITIADGANVENISTGKGEDTINILNNASAGKINTGAGNDTINIENSTINNNIQTENMFLGWFSTSSSDDTINITNSNIQGKLKSGLGNDTINTTSSTLNGKISSGWGDDNITVNETEVNANINADGGNDTIQITSSTLSQGNTVVAGGGTNNITIKDSNIDGALDAGLSTLNIENSTVKDLGYLNSQSNVTSTNSAIGSGAYTNIERVVTDLDTTAGSEFEGYELVSPSEETKTVYLIQDCTGKSRLVNVDEYICNDYETVITSYEQISFKLPDGSIVWANNDGGQVYVNSNGDVVLNGVNNANLTSNNSSKIIALNSNIIEHENIDCEVEYRNCIIENVRVAQNSQNANISTNNSNITNISVIDSSATINLNDTQVGNIIGRSQNENSVNVSINDGAIDGIKLYGSLGLNLEASEDASAFAINEITTQAGAIVGNINNANIDTIKTNDGSINLTANNSTINSVTNKNKEGETTIDFTNIQLDKIVSSAACDIQLNGCNVENKIKASNYDDSITVEESEIEKINSAYGQDLVEIYESEVESLSANGNTSIYGADIESLAASGNVAISNSEVNSFNASDSDNVYIKDSLVTTNVAYTSSTGYAANQQVNQTMPNMYIDNFDEIEIINNASLEEMQNDNVALARILEKETQNTQEVYSLLETLAPNEINAIVSQYGSLTQEEIISKILENPSDDLILIQEQLVLQMQGALKNLDNEIKNEKKSLGIISGICYVFDNDEVELEEKRELLEKAINSNDLGTILSTYTLLTDEVANAQMLSSTMSSLEYASSLDKDTASLILDTLDYIGNDLEYQMTSQDGLIKERIAYYNNLIGIGTNQREVQANLATYRQDVAELRENYLNGNLSNAEFAAEYKRITGNELNAENVNSLLDNVRGNDEFENVVEEKIEDYQETQQTVFQVGEYVVVIAAGAAVTLASGGAAGPAVAAALASFGQMGIALTATTVSLAVKIGMEATERQTNSIVADDMTPEEVAQTAALMYAGCLCGQFGNAMGKLIGPKTADFFAMYMSENAAKITTAIISKGLEFGSDTLASYMTTAMITGSGEFSEEFMENLKSEFIGWLQSKITGAYFAKHPEIQINSQLYIARKNSQGASEQEVNLSILKQFGFSEAEALEYSHMSAQEVDTIVLLKHVDLAELTAELKTDGSNGEESMAATLLTGLAAEAAISKMQEDGNIVQRVFQKTGFNRFEGSDSAKVIELGQKYPEAVLALSGMKDANGNYRFSSDDIIHLAESYGKNPDLVIKLVAMIDSEAYPRFTTEEVGTLCQIFAQAPEKLLELCKTYSETSDILEYASAYSLNPELTAELINMSTRGGSFGYYIQQRFSVKQVSELMRAYANDTEALAELAHCSINYNKYCFSAEDILALADAVHNNRDFVLNLCKLKATYYSATSIKEIADTYSGDQKILFDLIDAKTPNQHYVFDQYEILEIIKLPESEQLKYLEFVKEHIEKGLIQFSNVSKIQQVLKQYGDSYKVALELAKITQKQQNCPLFDTDEILKIGELLKDKSGIVLQIIEANNDGISKNGIMALIERHYEHPEALLELV
ncbi:MAG: S-layer family protein, partial [Candidatus Gastranaerophilales bacterium]|nr:S-layer family protein [Candidatus Gastranaerophilales bacterium]